MANGDRVINATRGLGASLAQGEVIPERIVLAPDGTLREKSAGGGYQRLGCSHMAARGKSLFQIGLDLAELGYINSRSNQGCQQLGQLLFAARGSESDDSLRR